MSSLVKRCRGKTIAAMEFFKSERNEKKILWTITVIALVLRLIPMIGLKSYLLEIPNEPDREWNFGYETGRIAKSIATGEGFSSPFKEPSGPTAWLMPVYPLFLALVFKLFGVYTTASAIVTLALNCLFSAVACIPLYHIAKPVFNRAVGYFAAAALALYPPSIWHAANTIWDTSLFTFLALVLMAWLFRLPQRFDVKNAALFGFFMGFVALVNAVIIAFYPFALIWLFLRTPLTSAKKITSIATICLVSGITLMPWIVRNYLVFDRLMLRPNLGVESKLGNSLRAWNAFESNGGKPAPFWELGHPTKDPDEFRRYVELGEVSYTANCSNEVMAFVREHPSKFLRLVLARVYEFWLGDLGRSDDFAGSLKTAISVSGVKKLCYVLPLPFMVAGILVALRRKLWISPLVAFLLLLPLAYYITHVTQRYRYPIEPIILILASYGFYTSIRRWRWVAS